MRYNHHHTATGKLPIFLRYASISSSTSSLSFLQPYCGRTLSAYSDKTIPIHDHILKVFQQLIAHIISVCSILDLCMVVYPPATYIYHDPVRTFRPYSMSRSNMTVNQHLCARCD